MTRIKALNLYQTETLLFLLVLTLVFSVLYPRTIARVGFSYRDTILVPSQNGGETSFSGKLGGKIACFTILLDKRVLFQHGEATYGPYTAKIDPTALPEKEFPEGSRTGVEIRKGDEILFRGSVRKFGGDYLLVSQSGVSNAMEIFYTGSDGIWQDQNGAAADQFAPTAREIITLLDEPELTHNGDWRVFFAGIFLAVCNAVSILFADEIFRWNLSFQIRNAEKAEPSELEIAGRYLGWTVLAGLSLIVFIIGLQ